MIPLKIAFVFLTLSVAISFSSTPSSFGAESSADLVVNNIEKEKLLREIDTEKSISEIDKEYKLGYRDVLLVTIYGEGSMAAGTDSAGTASQKKSSTSAKQQAKGIEVRMDGRVSLRHLGDIYVSGLTLTQLADYLKKLYSIIYEDPAITVTLAQSNSKHYTIMGNVKKPGLFLIPFPLTIVNAIAKAGDFTEWANSKVTVIRQDVNNSTTISSAKPLSPQSYPSNGFLSDFTAQESIQNDKNDINKHLFKFDFKDFLKGEKIEKNIIIKHNDVIVVH